VVSGVLLGGVVAGGVLLLGGIVLGAVVSGVVLGVASGDAVLFDMLLSLDIVLFAVVFGLWFLCLGAVVWASAAAETPRIATLNMVAIRILNLPWVPRRRRVPIRNASGTSRLPDCLRPVAGY
jgi:hypothetical protein